MFKNVNMLTGPFFFVWPWGKTVYEHREASFNDCTSMAHN